MRTKVTDSELSTRLARIEKTLDKLLDELRAVRRERREHTIYLPLVPTPRQLSPPIYRGPCLICRDYHHPDLQCPRRRIQPRC